jgi:hypothetical protein
LFWISRRRREIFSSCRFEFCQRQNSKRQIIKNLLYVFQSINGITGMDFYRERLLLIYPERNRNVLFSVNSMSKWYYQDDDTIYALKTTERNRLIRYNNFTPYGVLVASVFYGYNNAIPTGFLSP